VNADAAIQANDSHLLPWMRGPIQMPSGICQGKRSTHCDTMNTSAPAPHTDIGAPLRLFHQSATPIGPSVVAAVASASAAATAKRK
jgi:hypothetical protein